MRSCRLGRFGSARTRLQRNLRGHGRTRHNDLTIDDTIGPWGGEGHSIGPEGSGFPGLKSITAREGNQIAPVREVWDRQSAACGHPRGGEEAERHWGAGKRWPLA